MEEPHATIRYNNHRKISVRMVEYMTTLQSIHYNNHWKIGIRMVEYTIMLHLVAQF